MEDDITKIETTTQAPEHIDSTKESVSQKESVKNSVSNGSSTIDENKVFDPEMAASVAAALRDGVSQSGLPLQSQLLALRKKQDAYPNDIAAANKAREAKANIYALGQMLRLFSDMGTTVAGGNVYKERNQLPALLKDSDKQIANLVKASGENDKRINDILKQLGDRDVRLAIETIRQSVGKHADKKSENNTAEKGIIETNTVEKQTKDTTGGGKRRITKGGSGSGSGAKQISFFTPKVKKDIDGNNVEGGSTADYKVSTTKQWTAIANAAYEDMFIKKTNEDGIETVGLNPDYKYMVLALSGNQREDDIVRAAQGYHTGGVFGSNNTNANANFVQYMQRAALYTKSGREAYNRFAKEDGRPLCNTSDLYWDSSWGRAPWE